MELALQSLPFHSQAELKLNYKGYPLISKSIPDFILFFRVLRVFRGWDLSAHALYFKNAIQSKVVRLDPAKFLRGIRQEYLAQYFVRHYNPPWSDWEN